MVYIVYPSGTYKYTLKAARKLAQKEAKEFSWGSARVERETDNKVVARYSAGGVRENSPRGIASKLAKGIKAKWVQIKKVNGSYKVKIKK